ncbi:MAG: hypothetical protein ACRCZW_02885 [Lactobacillaceae bacterium]
MIKRDYITNRNGWLDQTNNQLGHYNKNNLNKNINLIEILLKNGHVPRGHLRELFKFRTSTRGFARGLTCNFCFYTFIVYFSFWKNDKLKNKLTDRSKCKQTII